MNGIALDKGYRDIEKENEFKMRKYFPLERAILQVFSKKKKRMEMKIPNFPFSSFFFLGEKK